MIVCQPGLDDAKFRSNYYVSNEKIAFLCQVSRVNNLAVPSEKKITEFLSNNHIQQITK